ncbi:CBO0543 family protein [Cohnella sp. 56]|uniref:CBO0543 family protein n=1 Tax=Cohnella sp. 56 TaxID=3113722 RepID=UPI0030E86522
MLIDWLWMGGSLLLLLLLLIRCVPGDRLREMYATLFTMQGIKWLIGVVKAELQLETYPVRLFPHATRLDFLTEFAICPSIAVLYIMLVPARPLPVQLASVVGIAGLFAAWNLLMTEFTSLQRYIHWSAWADFATILVLLPLVRALVNWIMAAPRRQEGDAHDSGSSG